jgi:hypothetical protein
VALPGGLPLVDVVVRVPMQAGGESFDLTARFITAAGDTVFTGTAAAITPTSSGAPASRLVPLRYVGIGAGAAGVRITVRDTATSPGEAVLLSAVVVDSGGSAIPGAPVGWLSLDTAWVQVTAEADHRGVAVGQAQRGEARLVAMLVTGQRDTSLVRNQPLPASMHIVAGNEQTATVGSAVAVPPRVRLLDAASLPVPGVAVTFSVSAGGGAVSGSSQVTDTLGQAAAAGWTLGTVAGSNELAVTAGTLSTRFVATGEAGSIARLRFTVQPSDVEVDSVIRPPVQVSAFDAHGNLATGFSGLVQLTFHMNPVDATLGGTWARNAVAGVASFDDLHVDKVGGGYVLLAMAAVAEDLHVDVAVPFSAPPMVGISTVSVPRGDNCDGATGRTCESLIGNVITDAMRFTYGTDFAILNSGTIRSNLTCPATYDPNDFCPPFSTPPWLIVPQQVTAVLPFGNTVATMAVNGAELKSMLENGVSRIDTNWSEGRFPQVSGLCFTYDIHQPVGARVLGAVRQAYNGSCTDWSIDLSAATAYTLAMNDFMAQGGDGYPYMWNRATQRGVMDEVVAKWIASSSPIRPSIQGRITCTSSGETRCPAPPEP